MMAGVKYWDVMYTVRPARMRSSFPLLEPGPPRFFGGMKTANSSFLLLARKFWEGFIFYLNLLSVADSMYTILNQNKVK